jgi:hypothetical protein
MQAPADRSEHSECNQSYNLCNEEVYSAICGGWLDSAPRNWQADSLSSDSSMSYVQSVGIYATFWAIHKENILA